MMENKLEKFISDNRDKFDRETPDPAILNRVLEQMQVKDKPKPQGIVVPLRVVIWAAASLVLMACGVIFLTLRRPQQNITIVSAKVSPDVRTKNADRDSIKQTGQPDLVKNETPGHKGIAAIDDDLDARKQAVAAKLRAQNLISRKEVMFASLNNMESPASRINATAEAGELKNADNDIVNALVQTLNTDPNANVRLAALDGLARFYRESYVRQKLIASLKNQQDPVVQITMINLLIRMHESGILTELERMVKDQNTQKAVKDCAYSGIFQLQSS
jgi:hypothetical protein